MSVDRKRVFGLDEVTREHAKDLLCVVDVAVCEAPNEMCPGLLHVHGVERGIEEDTETLHVHQSFGEEVTLPVQLKLDVVDAHLRQFCMWCPT